MTEAAAGRIVLLPPFFCVPGRAHLFGGASPLWARQGEPLAGRQGLPP